MGFECQIRPMEAEDIEKVMSVEKLSFVVSWSFESFENELKYNDFAQYYVAVYEDKIIAYAGMWIIVNEAHITNIAVHPEFRRKKVGKMLTMELILQAIIKGADRITLEVRESNLIAQKMYKDLGFKNAGVRKKYYSDNQENAIIMWKNLNEKHEDFSDKGE